MNKKQKQQEIDCIVKTMMQYNITLEEVSKHYHQTFIDEPPFDLLCKCDGLLKRVPFNIGKKLNPIAIFPDKRSPNYWNLEKLHGLRSKLNIDDSQIPTLDFFKVLFSKRQLLQKAFKELGAEEVNDFYLVNYKVYPEMELHRIGFWSFNVAMKGEYVGNRDQYVTVRCFGTFIEE